MRQLFGDYISRDSFEGNGEVDEKKKEERRGIPEKWPFQRRFLEGTIGAFGRTVRKCLLSCTQAWHS
jgi:hypothetical protein